MDYFNNFVIPFQGLKVGVHRFDFKADDKFFEQFKSAEILKGDVQVVIEMTKQERMLILDFVFNGWVEVSCDRCLDVFKHPVDGNERLIFKFGDDWQELSNEVIMIPEMEHQLNVNQYIYEFILLLLPMQRIHPEDQDGVSTCDVAMLERLDNHEEIEGIDPRWDALLKLKNKKK